MNTSNPENIGQEGGKHVPGRSKVTPGRVPPDVRADDPTAGEPVKKLTADEQMDLYEQHLKENDWGHQPC